jgi:hypothetical protein
MAKLEGILSASQQTIVFFTPSLAQGQQETTEIVVDVNKTRRCSHHVLKTRKGSENPQNQAVFFRMLSVATGPMLVARPSDVPGQLRRDDATHVLLAQACDKFRSNSPRFQPRNPRITPDSRFHEAVPRIYES